MYCHWSRCYSAELNAETQILCLKNNHKSRWTCIFLYFFIHQWTDSVPEKGKLRIWTLLKCVSFIEDDWEEKFQIIQHCLFFFFPFLNRCLFASFLTIALQTKLVYLTQILEVLTKDLMEQSSNVQPKLLLRRTESVVEKLLTNWMSVCLSGFLRVSVHFFTA